MSLKPRMSSFSTTQRTLGSQTIGILNANSLHFIPISLFFLTFTFSAHLIVGFYFSSPAFDDAGDFEPFNLLLLKTIIFNCRDLLIFKSLITLLAFIFFVILPTVAGVALITYSTNQVIQGRPPTFSSAFKSLSHSYIPLLSTTIAGSMKLVLIFVFLTLSPIAITRSVKAFGFHLRPFVFSIFVNTLASYALVITILYFMVIRGISAAIAVLERKSGFQPLQQSAKRLKESFKSHSFLILLQTGFVILPSLSYSALAGNIGGSTTNWILMMQICAIYLQSSLMMLYYVVANTVLYVQCKAARGEDIEKTTVDDFSGEYVGVLVNEKDDEVSYEPAIGGANGGFIYMMYLLFIFWVALLFLM